MWPFVQGGKKINGNSMKWEFDHLIEGLFSMWRRCFFGFFLWEEKGKKVRKQNKNKK